MSKLSPVAERTFSRRRIVWEVSWERMYSLNRAIGSGTGWRVCILVSILVVLYICTA